MKEDIQKPDEYCLQEVHLKIGYYGDSEEQRYVVTKLVNATKPHVGDVLTEEHVQSLMPSYKVVITV